MNLNGKRFMSVSNTENGEVGSDTLFRYFEDSGVVWAEYSGGAIVRGNMIGKRVSEDKLDLRYQHLSRDGKIKTGICHSTLIKTGSGQVRILEKWKWTCDDFSEGESELAEVAD